MTTALMLLLIMALAAGAISPYLKNHESCKPIAPTHKDSDE